MKRREFLTVGVCTAGALMLSRSLVFAESAPRQSSHATRQVRYRLHGSPRTGCAHAPADYDAIHALAVSGHPI